MDSRSALFSFPDPYDLEGSRSLFLQAIEENVLFHYNACPEYRKIAQARGFSPHPLQTERELAELPILPTILFKRHDLRSMGGKKTSYHRHFFRYWRNPQFHSIRYGRAVLRAAHGASAGSLPSSLFAYSH